MADTVTALGVPLTRDRFFGGRLSIAQPAKGHRAGTDAVLLTAAVPRLFDGFAFDAGAGVGTAGLGVALLCPAARVGLIENDAITAALACDNVNANGLEDRVAVHAFDLVALAGGASRGTADVVISNPPFHAPGSVRASPDPRRRAAHVFNEHGLDAWIDACLALLRSHGSLIVIHRCEALPSLLRALDRKAGSVTLLAVHTKTGAPAKRILLRAVKDSRGPFSIARALVLSDGDAPTAEATSINKGLCAIDW